MFVRAAADFSEISLFASLSLSEDAIRLKKCTIVASTMLKAHAHDVWCSLGDLSSPGSVCEE